MRIPVTAKPTPISLLLKKGFTLIELLVSMGIIVIITSVALVQHNQFNETLALTNLAYEVGLSVRQAQVFGISVREFRDRGTPGSNATANILYGVNFESPDISQTGRTEYVLYADLNDDGEYSDQSEEVEKITITRGNFIDQFCGMTSATTDCSTSTEPLSSGSLKSLSIQFRRPNPDAVIKGDVGTGTLKTYDRALIILKSKDGAATRCVLVRPTGQVSIQTTCATP